MLIQSQVSVLITVTVYMSVTYKLSTLIHLKIACPVGDIWG